MAKQAALRLAAFVVRWWCYPVIVLHPRDGGRT
jgi:hypothetical protein